ncbi:MAG TPA: hypothetical protein VMW10_10650 [Alphaproteobacteria bacterium]|nr:hypothetical protein [Alphaproteobacteria bacterium]
MQLAIKTSFTDSKKCVNLYPCESGDLVGKNLGEFCLFKSPGDAKSLKACPLSLTGAGFRDLGQRTLSLNTPLSLLLFSSLFLGSVFFPSELWAHTGEVLKDEIEKVEKLFTGGYMRLGLLGVCGFAAIFGIVKQNGWIFASGILGCVFAYFMKDWILKTFTAVV